MAICLMAKRGHLNSVKRAEFERLTRLPWALHHDNDDRHPVDMEASKSCSLVNHSGSPSSPSDLVANLTGT